MHDAPEPGNLADLVRRAAQAGADRPALRAEDRMVTWGQLDERVDAAARGLRALNLQAAEHPARVAIALPNTIEFAVIFFGVLRAGLVAAPVNPGCTARELRHVLGDSGAAVLIGTADVLTAIEPVRPALPALDYLFGAGDLPLAPGDPVHDAGTGGEDLAVLIYTSGTAGQPKGAMLSHRALLANHAQLARVQPPPVGPADVVLLAVPLFHAYGLNGGLGAVAYHGAAGVLVERFDPAETLALVARHRVTAIVGVPPMYVAWSLLAGSGPALQTVRLAASGAAPLDPAAARRFIAATQQPIFEGYGLTETAPVLTSTVVSPVPKIGSIGRPLPGVELRLVGADGSTLWTSDVDEYPSDVDDDGDELGSEAPGSPGTDPGEIVARGANLFSGYWPDGRDGPDAEGWWATGDVAYADGDGDLFLVDRLGELILVSGFNVYPHEVEQVICAHRGVADAAVVGIPHPYTGQTVKAYVVRAPDSEVGTDELLRHCERNLARFKCPTAVEFVPALPYSAIGKVRKAALKSGVDSG
ncbi:MAG TPA: AMP-binding protein [Micromonosporaceae bacterium]|nr:AMP-binding protein [Micromonosporaceae bacterium]